MESFDELRHVVRILPLLDSFEEAKIHQGNCGGSAYSRSAVNVNVESKVVYHVVQVLSHHKETRTVFIFVVVKKWEAETPNVALLVGLL